MPRSVKRKSKKSTGGKLGPVVLDKDKLDKNAFYCVKCRALCFSKRPDVKIGKAKNGRPMLSGKCANKKSGSVCGTKVVRFY